MRDEKWPKPGPFAERCPKLAQVDPETPTGLAALCWAATNAPDGEAGQKALALLKGGPIAHADPEDLMNALDSAWTPNHKKSQELAPLVLDRMKQKLDHSAAARLLTWVCTCYFGDGSAEVPRVFAESAELIAYRFADSPDIANFCECLGHHSSSPPWAGKYEKHLRTILEANRHRSVRVCAQFALACVVQSTGEARQEETEQLFQQFIMDYAGQEPKELGFLPSLLSRARAELEEIRTRGLGKPAPEIEGEDLDGKPMRLSDFKGKVLLLDFWGFW
ncbi:MAG: hypothetical protein L0Z62_00515 [Gemmataceae bacterium]|nr:hypothetical protein [Gemmataceae bacterium]